MEMKKDSISISIVLDEYGSTAGLITMEDLIEEIVGEIRDEYDYDEEDLIKTITEKKFIIDGSAKLEDINEALNLSLSSDSYDSLAGHILFLLSHIPLEGEKLTHEGITYTVKKLDKNRIEKVLIELE
jgi:CBS domain containing-hemolysin-like protein